MRVLMIGIGYFPWRTAGDKNFFVDLVAGLKRQLGSITVLSVNDLDEAESRQETEFGAVRILNARRPLHLGDPARFFHSAEGIRSYHHLHKPPQEILERHLTIMALARRIRRLVREGEIELVHFMDNFGVAMPWLRRVLGGPAVTVTALRYDPRGWPYRFYLRRSFTGLDGVGCMTDAYRQILVRLGLDDARVATVRWGAGPQLAVDEARSAAAGARFGLGAGACLLVWAGFIQQIAEESLRVTARLAHRLVERDPNLHVVLALKPESWRNEFRELAGERVHVERGVPDFPALLARADCLVSPVIKTSATVAPPLTWLEALSLGTPVATTDALGAGEAVIDGQTGLVRDTAEELEEPLLELLADPGALAAMSRHSLQLAQSRFAFELITDDYVRFFESAVSRRRGGRR